MASSTGTPAGRGSGVGCFSSFRILGGLLYQVIEVFTKSAVHLLLIHIFTETKMFL